MIQTPVIFFIYKRINPTKLVFETISQIKPRNLYIIADGPKNEEEKYACLNVREVVSKIDWPCNVKRLYSNNNLGVRDRIISGLDWVFEKEDRAIILEDDCLPDGTFFKYCEELLEFYKNHPKVMTISGNNFMFGKKITSDSYYFTKYHHIWGWATWKRAWEQFHSWDPKKSYMDMRIFQNHNERSFWSDKVKLIKLNKMDYTWDYQWSLVCMSQKSMCISPNVNLVSNIGFGAEASNSKFLTKYANIPTYAMTFPLVHPTKMIWNDYSDRQSSKLFFQPPSGYLMKIIRLMKFLWKNTFGKFIK